MSSALAVPLVLAMLGATPTAVVIEHSAPPDRAPVLEARMVSTAGRAIFEPTAFVRPVGAVEYQRLPMQPVGRNTYRVALPPALARRDCEYFLEAFDEDGNGPFRKGTPERPLRLALSGPARRAPAKALPDASAASSSPSRPRRTAGIALVVGGGLAVAGGAISGILALRDYNAEKAATDLATYQRAKSAATTEAVVADVLYGVGGTAMATGIILWATDRPSGPARLSLGGGPTPGGVRAALRAEF